MRCPPSLVFDDLYQRCEWPSAGVPSPNHRLGSLRNKQDLAKNEKKIIDFKTTMKQKSSTVSSMNTNYKIAEP